MEGLISAAGICRREGIPYFGIGLGMQMAVVEIARHEAGLNEAGSDEADFCGDDIFYYPAGRKSMETTPFSDWHMRAGACTTVFAPDTPLHRIYRTDEAVERHHHRRELNPAYQSQLIAAGLGIGGTDPDKLIVNAVFWPEHPVFIGTL